MATPTELIKNMHYLRQFKNMNQYSALQIMSIDVVKFSDTLVDNLPNELSNTEPKGFR